MKRLNSLFQIFFVALAFTSFVACSDDDTETPTPTEEQTITEIAAADAQFSTLVDALTRVDLAATLGTAGPFTVFAPTDAAFTALGVDLSALTDDQLTDILLYHVIIGSTIRSTDLGDGVQTYAGTGSDAGANGTSASLLVERAGTAVTLNGTTNVTTADIIASNGVIHVIDQVLQPLSVVGHAIANSNFTSLVGALQAADGDLVTVLSGDGPFTVFAPLNSAFTAIESTTATLTTEQLSKVLTYHVLSGNNLSTDLVDGQSYTTVNGETFTVNIGADVTITDANGNISTVQATDIQGTNGVVHVLNAVIIPSQL